MRPSAVEVNGSENDLSCPGIEANTNTVIQPSVPCLGRTPGQLCVSTSTSLLATLGTR